MIIRLFMCFLLTMSAFSSNAKGFNILTDSLAKESEKQDDVYEIVEQSPVFPGGPAAMMSFIANNLVYPAEARSNGIIGAVVVEFIVEKDGSLSNIKVIKDIGGGCGDAVVEVIAAMPLWQPGMQRDTPVRVKMKAPVRFRML
jgi:protein TonB